jgi:hypothetical protein
MSAAPPRSRSFRERVDEMFLRAMEEDPAFLWDRPPPRPPPKPRPNVLLPRRLEDDSTSAGRAPLLSPAAAWTTGKRWWRYKVRFVQVGARKAAVS